MDKDEIAEGVNDIRSPICAEAFVEAEQSLTLTQLTLDDAGQCTMHFRPEYQRF